MKITTDDMRGLLTALSQKRRVFCSELDFQLHLAWEMKERGWDVALEYDPQCFEGNAAIDILVLKPERVAVELKYKTTRFVHQIDGQPINLKQQAAQTIARYELIKDVSRVEAVVASGRADHGFTIALTNDPSYWRKGREGTAAEMFRMHDGRKVLKGEHRWGANTGAGTMDGRTQPIVLTRDFVCDWSDYTTFSDIKNGTFRYLLVSIERLTGAEVNTTSAV